VGVRRRRRSLRRSRPSGVALPALGAPHRSWPRQWHRIAHVERPAEGSRQPSY
jgi:hypothetical protein